MWHKGVSRTLFLWAWDLTTDPPSPKTGYASNITLYKVEDSGNPTQVTGISEVDADNCPGLYRVSVTISGDSVAFYARGASNDIRVELADAVYANIGSIPAVAAGESGGLPVIGEAPLDLIEYVFSPIIIGQTTSVSLAPQAFSTNLSGTANDYKGKFLKFISGTVNEGQTRLVVNFADSVIYLDRPLPNTPEANETFILIGYGGIA